MRVQGDRAHHERGAVDADGELVLNAASSPPTAGPIVLPIRVLASGRTAFMAGRRFLADDLGREGGDARVEESIEAAEDDGKDDQFRVVKRVRQQGETRSRPVKTARTVSERMSSSSAGESVDDRSADQQENDLRGHAGGGEPSESRHAVGGVKNEQRESHVGDAVAKVGDRLTRDQQTAVRDASATR